MLSFKAFLLVEGTLPEHKKNIETIVRNWYSHLPNDEFNRKIKTREINPQAEWNKYRNVLRKIKEEANRNAMLAERDRKANRPGEPSTHPLDNPFVVNEKYMDLRGQYTQADLDHLAAHLSKPGFPGHSLLGHDISTAYITAHRLLQSATAEHPDLQEEWKTFSGMPTLRGERNIGRIIAQVMTKGKSTSATRESWRLFSNPLEQQRTAHDKEINKLRAESPGGGYYHEHPPLSTAEAKEPKDMETIHRWTHEDGKTYVVTRIHTTAGAIHTCNQRYTEGGPSWCTSTAGPMGNQIIKDYGPLWYVHVDGKPVAAFDASGHRETGFPVLGPDNQAISEEHHDIARIAMAAAGLHHEGETVTPESVQKRIDQINSAGQSVQGPLVRNQNEKHPLLRHWMKLMESIHGDTFPPDRFLEH